MKLLKDSKSKYTQWILPLKHEFVCKNYQKMTWYQWSTTLVALNYNQLTTVAIYYTSTCHGM